MPIAKFYCFSFMMSYKWGWVHTGLMNTSIVFFASVLDKLEEMGKRENRDGLKRLRVVLADDDPDDREMFEEAISRINPQIEVVTLVNGMSLIRELEDGADPDMIFLDLNMPGKNGRECLAAIRQNASWNKIPIVIYSTSASKRDVNETYHSGANLYLLKPNSFQDLVQIIRRVFSIDLESTRLLQQNYLLLKGA
jgi:CheY-like chemotaxis protein